MRSAECLSFLGGDLGQRYLTLDPYRGPVSRQPPQPPPLLLGTVPVEGRRYGRHFRAVHGHKTGSDRPAKVYWINGTSIRPIASPAIAAVTAAADGRRRRFGRPYAKLISKSRRNRWTVSMVTN